jgi:hypothetical protein
MGECELVELIGVKIVKRVTQSVVSARKITQQVKGKREDQFRRVDEEGPRPRPRASIQLRYSVRSTGPRSGPECKAHSKGSKDSLFALHSSTWPEKTA